MYVQEVREAGVRLGPEAFHLRARTGKKGIVFMLRCLALIISQVGGDCGR